MNPTHYELIRVTWANDNVEDYKRHFACLWRQKLKQSFSSVSGKLTNLGLFFVQNKD